MAETLPYEKGVIHYHLQGLQSLTPNPQILGRGVVGIAWGSGTGREIGDGLPLPGSATPMVRHYQDTPFPGSATPRVRHSQGPALPGFPTPRVRHSQGWPVPG